MNMQERIAASRARMVELAKVTQLEHFKNWVLVRHQDGSEFLFNYAFKYADPEDTGFFWVFTEHVGNHLFVVEDVEMHRVFKVHATS